MNIYLNIKQPKKIFNNFKGAPCGTIHNTQNVRKECTFEGK